MSRMKQKYNDIVPTLRKECEIKNSMQTPKLEKIVISVGAGKEGTDSKLIANMADTISLIAGQKAVIVNAKKSVAGFKAREGAPSGIRVTLRGENMYNFFDKLVSISLPRVKDFRGVSRKGFDGRGNYNFGLQEQLMFPEVDFDSIIKTHGMNITIVTSTEDDKEAFTLLEKLGMPFAKGRN
ncbi:MAG: 50S ribosomal protein L5 [Sulfurovum sp.]|nr:50S ribosomal protein L5 [Sulfurovum sp.]MCB4759427.1 50S ribosomal protein L5 [Sulfurovum sp.]